MSLHRSEGLGLHLAEAMWLGTPTIATRYSGNLDFMDDDVLAAGRRNDSVPVGAARACTRPTPCGPTPIWMLRPRRCVGWPADPALCARLSAAGRSKMESQPSLADTGRLVARLLGSTAIEHTETCIEGTLTMGARGRLAG